jgi:hypothetical protein
VSEYLKAAMFANRLGRCLTSAPKEGSGGDDDDDDDDDDDEGDDDEDEG